MSPRFRCLSYGLLLAVAGIALTAIILWVFHTREAEFAKDRLISDARQKIMTDDLEDNLQLRRVFGDLTYLVAQVETSLANRKAVSALIPSIKHFAENVGVYDQIRYLDETGREVLRINWNATGGATVVSAHKLQNKSDRYYFKGSIDLPQGEFYVSALDLNVDDGQIEQPLKPVLRVGATTRDASGQIKGVVLLNYLAVNLLQAPETLDLMHISEQGDWMQGGQLEDRWGTQLGHGRSFAQSYPEAWSAIHENGQSSLENGKSLFLAERFCVAECFDDSAQHTENLPYWYIVSYFEDFDVASGMARLRSQLYVFFLLAVLVWGPIGALTSWLLCQRRQAHEAMQAAIREAESANRAKSQFLSAMSHEIRTPMNGVLGMTQLLEMTNLDEEQKECTQIIASSGETLLTIIDDILDYSKIEAGCLELDPVTENPRELISMTIDLLNPAAKEKGLLLEADFEDSLPGQIVCDTTRVRQILYNLIGNAVKFTDHGRVCVHAGTVKDEGAREWLRIAVSDTGIGMTPAQIERLFQPFSQADSSITRRFGGTGLGLSISKSLLELMGGTIEVTSEAGASSTFALKIPINGSAVITARRSLSSDEKKELAAHCEVFSNRVLIVDDNQINRHVLANLLSTYKLKADMAEDGMTALKMAEKKQHCLIFMDIRMPGMDGYEAADRILEQRKGSEEPLFIVAVSASALPEERSACLERGMFDFIAKPVRIDQLEAVLKKCLGNLDSWPN